MSYERALEQVQSKIDKGDIAGDLSASMCLIAHCCLPPQYHEDPLADLVT